MNQYLTYTRDALVSALARISQSIIDSHSHLAFLKSEEARARRDAWNSYSNESVSAREKLTSILTTDARIALLEEESEMARFVEEKYFIKYLLDNVITG